MTAFSAGIPFVTGRALRNRIRELLWYAASQGVTLLHDCGIGSIGGPSDLVGGVGGGDHRFGQPRPDVALASNPG